MTTRIVMLIAFITVAALLMGACGAPQPQTDPEGMSAADHEAAAKEHERRAAEHTFATDEAAQRFDRGPGGGMRYRNGYYYYWPDDLDQEGWSQYVYDPRPSHQSVAQSHREHASEHRAAARALAEFEDAECAAFDDEIRSTCPLLGLPYSVQNIPFGVRIELEDDTPLDAVYMHMRCHHAFGASNGYQGMPNCILYIKSLVISRSGERHLDLTTPSETLVHELRRRAGVEPGNE